MIDGEVDIGTGRIDLIGESPQGEVIGVELKRASEFRLDRELYEQTHRYLDSEAIDQLFFASPDAAKLGDDPSSDPYDIFSIRSVSYDLAAGVDAGWYTPSEVITSINEGISPDFLSHEMEHRTVEELIRKLLGRSPDNDPISLDEAVDRLRRARLPEELGVIDVPVELDGSKSEVEDFLTPGAGPSPTIIREADTVEVGETGPGISPQEEPWVRHHAWRHFGGIPEGHIPNDLDSDQPSRPIDIVAFDGDIDPTAATTDPESNAVVGIEAKGASSFPGSRKVRQLQQFLATDTLSLLYLAVPTTLVDRAIKSLQENDISAVGVIAVDDDGSVEIAREATRQSPTYDGYLDNHTECKVGYGDQDLPWLEPVSNPYLTDEEAERVKHPDPEAYAKRLLDSAELDDTDSFLSIGDRSVSEKTENEFTKDNVRYYLLPGEKAGPYLVDSNVGQDEMMSGYVRLGIEWFEDIDDAGVKLNFGGGSWVGGYLWFTGDTVHQLFDVLLNIEELMGATVGGQGKVLDLATFPIEGESDHLRLKGRFGEEELLELEIRNLFDNEEEDEVLAMDLGTGARKGVTVRFTRSQWYDLIATLHVLLQGGSYRELPGEHSSTPRIGPMGDDTWGIGTDIEETSNPGPIDVQDSGDGFF